MNFLANTAFTVAERAFSIGLRFLIVLQVARALGPEGQGEFAFARSIWVACYVIFSLGLEPASNYLAASLQRSQLRYLLGHLLLATALLPTIPALLLLIGTRLTAYLDPISAHFPILVLGLFVHFLALLVQGPLFGRGEFRTVMIASTLRYLFTSLLLLGLVSMGWLSVHLALCCWIAGSVLSILLNGLRLLSLADFRIAVNAALLRQQMSFGRRAYWLNVMTSLNLRLDTFFIAFLLSMNDLGVYSLAVAFSEVVLFLPIACTRVILTQVSSKNELGQGVFRNLSGLTLLTTAGLAAFAPVAIPFLFPEFSASVGLLLLLLPGVYCLGMAQVFCFYLMGKNRIEIPSRAALVALLLTVVGNPLLIPLLGITGAALTSILSYATYFLLLLRGIRAVSGEASIRPSFSWIQLLSSYLRGGS